MNYQVIKISFVIALCTVGLLSCGPAPTTGEDAQVTSLGAVEVTAQLLEYPGELVDKPFYDYTFVFKYNILETHRGEVPVDTIYVGHYNPIKARSAAADERVEDVGGDLAQFRVGDIHRIALEAPIDDYYMGGIINRFFEEQPDPIYWAVWTNRVIQ